METLRKQSLNNTINDFNYSILVAKNDFLKAYNSLIIQYL